jgi:hypothetical protein
VEKSNATDAKEGTANEQRGHTSRASKDSAGTLSTLPLRNDQQKRIPYPHQTY